MTPDWLVLNLSSFQLYGLIFLLGSFTVASLSDLKRMSAQSEFVEVWVLCLIGFIVLDLWKLGDIENFQFMLKWGLIIVFIVLSNSRIGLIFKLAMGDVMACAVVMALLTPAFIIIFILILKLFDLLFRPILRGFGNRDAYPFMPVVLAATLAVIAIVFYLNGQIAF
ncbi:MAG: hypothetical protein KKH41_00675 [Candidatus Thermoplasmatota archaeon]|nr:hypothetical protein [Euryarchaeota archaeon]MBU4032897.1 hypothetical protein [Candidatus Thermoplasmatota archaeon]MBU4145297.1 hypothetical protein [Candidatus Thermoplasmatota archaeon]MBU4591076.1 hypothetical protein [Candidatus Thermoplasmatota archaeon]